MVEKPLSPSNESINTVYQIRRVAGLQRPTLDFCTSGQYASVIKTYDLSGASYPTVIGRRGKGLRGS